MSLEPKYRTLALKNQFYLSSFKNNMLKLFCTRGPRVLTATHFPGKILDIESGFRRFVYLMLMVVVFVKANVNQKLDKLKEHGDRNTKYETKSSSKI